MECQNLICRKNKKKISPICNLLIFFFLPRVLFVLKTINLNNNNNNSNNNNNNNNNNKKKKKKKNFYHYYYYYYCCCYYHYYTIQ